MENIEFSPIQLSLAGEISVSQKNNILTDRIILQISGRKQISAQTVINGTTVWWCLINYKILKIVIFFEASLLNITPWTNKFLVFLRIASDQIWWENKLMLGVDWPTDSNVIYMNKRSVQQLKLEGAIK